MLVVVESCAHCVLVETMANKENNRWGGSRGAAGGAGREERPIGRGERSGAEKKMGGAVDVLGREERPMGWGERSVAEKKGAVDGTEREQRRQNKEGRSMGWGERGE
jgi:hypothetical protein